MNTYSIIKKSVHDRRSITGYKNCDYNLALYGLREILKQYKEEAPYGKKGKCERINRNTIAVYDGGDLIGYEIIKDKK